MPMHYGRSLYQSNEIYTVHRFKTRSEWLAGRSDLHGIGGSDASAALGMNPWRTNLDLWQIKTGRKQAPDISDNERVRYGQNAEEYIRRIFQLKTAKEYEIQYLPDVILVNNERPYMLYSPDGLILENVTGRRGIFECKTAGIMSSIEKEKWNDRIPDNYFIQVIHGLNVSGFDFIELYAELIYDKNYSQLRRYHIERSEKPEELQTELEGITEFWNKYVITDTQPPLIIRGL